MGRRDGQERRKGEFGGGRDGKRKKVGWDIREKRGSDRWGETDGRERLEGKSGEEESGGFLKSVSESFGNRGFGYWIERWEWEWSSALEKEWWYRIQKA